ncbi:hypothetical protein MNBD_NITROSPINAE03-750 [hydrothermal vent metagenome]|uniref:Uncharacterized protein n=1 Tax=hydrothermal vent metagenome TaxID=652676 RepID=A0A3B1CNG9_9ZZZZ
MDNKKREKELKELSHIIVDALSNNREVVSHLNDLKERKVIDSSTLLGLALKVCDLLNIPGAAFAQEDINISGRKRETGISSDDKAGADETARQLKAVVDGKELTPSQRQFQRWAMENFDEKKWLSKIGVIW